MDYPREPHPEKLMSVSSPCPPDHLLMKAWNAYKETERYANAKRWATHSAHVDGSLWASFMDGWNAATKRAGDLHESVSPASDEERLNDSPGAGAMGAVIEYRDAIRATT